MGAIRTLPASAQPRGAASIQRLLAPLAPWALPVFLIVAWQAASRTGLLSTRILPEPLAVAKAFGDLAVSGELWVFNMYAPPRRGYMGVWGVGVEKKGGG
ncbi:hypothetical protein ACEN88_33940, partial [Massilia sp. CT11-108]